jgi:hypothetical protein
VRDVCNELRSGLMLVAQASAKEQIKAFDSQGAQCVCVCVCVCVFSDLGFDESYAVTVRKVGGFALHLRGFALDDSSSDPKPPGICLRQLGCFRIEPHQTIIYLKRTSASNNSLRIGQNGLGPSEMLWLLVLWHLELPHECIKLMCSYVVLTFAFWRSTLADKAPTRSMQGYLALAMLTKHYMQVIKPLWRTWRALAVADHKWTMAFTRYSLAECYSLVQLCKSTPIYLTQQKAENILKFEALSHL